MLVTELITFFHGLKVVLVTGTATKVEKTTLLMAIVKVIAWYLGPTISHYHWFPALVGYL